jgi:hypothetical protein
LADLECCQRHLTVRREYLREIMQLADNLKEKNDMLIAEICTTMQLYFDIMHECDLEKFDRVFHPTCSLFTAKDGTHTVRPFTQYRAEIEKRIPPKTLGQPREETVLSIALLSPEIALAQVRVRIFEKIFIDNLNLLKIDGNWMIVAKIYHHVDSII